MRPEDVPADLVEKALNTRLPSGGLPTLNEPQMRAILAAVLPLAQSEAWKQGALTADPNLDPSAADEYNPYGEKEGES